MSTDKQASLDAYTSANAEADPEPSPDSEPRQRPSWAPDDAPENAGVCLGCESHVSAEFARVMGDNQQDVHACPKCANQGELARGAAANPDYEHRTTTQGAWR